MESILNKWIPVKGYEGFYEINSNGEIRSCERVIFQPGHGYRKLKEFNLCPWDNGNGYKVVSLSKNGKRKNHYVHRLVAEHFIPNPNNFLEINHIDYDKSNNKSNNLEWTDRASNVRYSAEHMKRPRTKAYSNTGHLYITKRKNGTYRIIVNKKEKRARSIDEAIKIRDELIRRRDQCQKAF